MAIPKKKRTQRSVVNRAAIMLISFCATYAAICVAFHYLELSQVYSKAQATGEAASSVFAFRLEYMLRPPKSLSTYMTVMGASFAALYILWRSERNWKIAHGNKDLEGTAEWAQPKEIKNMLQSVDEKHPEQAETAGIILARENGRLFFDDSTIQSLIIGATRSGKTQYFVLPMLRLIAMSKNKHSMVINDIKGELLENSYDLLVKNGYQVIILNLKDTDQTHLWNPLSLIIEEYKFAVENNHDLSKVNDFIDTLAHTLTHDPTAEAIWPSSAKSLLTAMIFYLLEVGYKNNTLDKLNMYSVYNFFIEYGSQTNYEQKNGMAIAVNALDQLFQNLPIGSPAKAAYATSNFAQGDMRSSIFATLADDIEIFGRDAGIATMTCGNDITFEELTNIDQPCAIFMVVPDDRPNRHVIASLFINQCYVSLVEYLNRNELLSLPRRVDFILDEFGNMVRIPGMDNKITVSAGRNILWHLFIQDLNQLDTKYEKEAKTIRSNCGNFVYILSNDNDTNEYVSKMLGHETKEYTTYDGKLDEWLTHQSQHQKGRPLFFGDELRRFQYGETVVIRSRMNPIYSVFTPFYKLKLPITKIRQIPLHDNRRALAECLFPFDQINKFSANEESKQLEKNVHFSTERIQPVPSHHAFDKSILSPRSSSTNAADKHQDSKLSALKSALTEVDQITEGAFGNWLVERDFEQCTTILKRIKMKRQMDPDRVEILINYLKSSGK